MRYGEGKEKGRREERVGENHSKPKSNLFRRKAAKIWRKKHDRKPYKHLMPIFAYLHKDVRAWQDKPTKTEHTE